MAPLLPDIGRSGLINSVRRLSGLNNPGYREEDPTANFIAGMDAKLEADSSGNPVLKVAGASDTNLIGIFFCHKNVNFYQTIVDEEQTFGDSPNTSIVVYLDHANLKSGSVKVTDENGSAYTETTDYTVNLTNGVITRTTTGSIAADETVLISYMYEDPNLTGLDQTAGSGLAATLEDPGEIATLIYDTSKSYTLMGNLYANANGYLTSTNGGGSVVGKVTKVPTADDPELRYKLQV